MSQTIRVETELPAEADRVWSAMKHPASFLYVCRGLLGWPSLAGRTDPLSEGESGSGWLLLFHVLPMHRHHIRIVRVDETERTIETEEHGGLIRGWHHTLHVEPVAKGRSRYSDTVDIEAGGFTPVVATLSVAIYRYRQLRWRRLARKHLSRPAPPAG
jgi:hypothetical protein